VDEPLENVHQHVHVRTPVHVRGSSWKKNELSLGVVAWICLVYMTDYTYGHVHVVSYK